MITNLEILRAFFISQPHILFAYLFGSQARGQAHALSDIDVAVMLAESLNADQRFATRLDLMGEVSHLTQTNAVDVLILNDAPLALAYRVLHDGRLLACHDRDQLIAYTARTVNAYLDFKPVIERHERAILARAQRGELLHGHNPHRGALERYRQRRQRLEESAKSEL
jgi:hypothetical protein